jgi:hypothetical protein
MLPASSGGQLMMKCDDDLFFLSLRHDQCKLQVALRGTETLKGAMSVMYSTAAYRNSE